MKIQFFMPMVPPTVTAQEHKVAVRNGEPHFYDPPELKAAKEKLVAHLSQHTIPQPLTSGVRLVTKWLFPIQGSHKNGESCILRSCCCPVLGTATLSQV